MNLWIKMKKSKLPEPKKEVSCDDALIPIVKILIDHRKNSMVNNSNIK